jgi:hypothetical protein
VSDASVRFMVELDSAGQVKAVKAIQGLGEEAARQGKRFGDGVQGGFRKMADEWARFVAGGMVLQRLFQSLTNTIKQAGDMAKARQSDWDKTNAGFRSDRMQRLTSDASLRLSGLSEDSIWSLQGQLSDLKKSGRDVGGDFSGILRTLAQRGLSGEALGSAAQEALTGLGKRGHLGGFGDAYQALAGGAGVAKGADLTDLATGLLKRTFGMQDGQAEALRAGIAGGGVGIDQGGNVRAIGEASAELAAALRAINAAGGLSLKAWEKPKDLNGLDSRVGYGYNVRAGLDAGLDWMDPGQAPSLGNRPNGKASLGDYASTLIDQPAIQAALGAALIKLLDGGAGRAAGRLAAGASALAATGIGRATGGALAGTLAGAGRVAGAMGGPAGLLLSWQEAGMGQDEEDWRIKMGLPPSDTSKSRAALAARLARNTGMSAFDAEASLDRMDVNGQRPTDKQWAAANEIGNPTLVSILAVLQEQTKLMRASALVPAQRGQ